MLGKTIVNLDVAAGNLPAPLPPSVEEAYRKKCIELKRRMTEVEESNDAFRLRKVRLTRAIRKMRLERAYLLETLGKRMKKNGGSNEMQGFLDEESEGSSEGPPTPHEKPLRSKRSHRRNVPSPPPVLDNNISQANPQYQAPAFHAYEPRRDGDPNVAMRSPTNGQPMIQQYHPTEGQQSALHTHPIVPVIPPPTAFQMYAEARFLSQPHNHSSKHGNTHDALMQLAHETWDTESEGVKQYYLLQESKAKESHDAKVAAAREYEAQHPQEAMRGGATSEDRATSSEQDRERGGEVEKHVERVETERMQVDEAEKAAEAEAEAGGPSTTGAGGFTSING